MTESRDETEVTALADEEEQGLMRLRRLHIGEDFAEYE